ncbi:hypothetical protein D0817_20330 [Flavobacterium cupreum]|uniref:Uncharacterized protein n=1 Tax=Flavobacterium cupreum TaxID=2133766 RepID=A0A434A2A0_9FLAO|nr:hypothetical protein [Flavobacterium cupreum]RUT68482.1 hypothetical protein D0817_20330 [Flavobacterium cupreum]
MFSLDASGYSESSFFYEYEFERILSKIVICYQMMAKDTFTLSNNENAIRDYLLLNYLKNDTLRRDIDLLDYHFEREVPEDSSIGRTDIKIISKNTFEVQEAYYIIECKRLNNINISGTTGLNAEYIKNGIYRYTTNYYKSYYRVNGMIAFVVDDMNIQENIKMLNILMTTSFTNSRVQKEITKDSFVENFDYHYHSQHIDNDNNILKLYHLIFNFKDNILN